MISNPATIIWKGLNEFTTFVKDNPGCVVRLRNGDIVQPKFYPAEDEYCEDVFTVGEYHRLYRWDSNGVALKNSDYDMMKIVSNEL
jgi:hypothetical protein